LNKDPRDFDRDSEVHRRSKRDRERDIGFWIFKKKNPHSHKKFIIIIIYYFPQSKHSFAPFMGLGEKQK